MAQNAAHERRSLNGVQGSPTPKARSIAVNHPNASIITPSPSPQPGPAPTATASSRFMRFSEAGTDSLRRAHTAGTDAFTSLTPTDATAAPAPVLPLTMTTSMRSPPLRHTPLAGLQVHREDEPADAFDRAFQVIYSFIHSVHVQAHCTKVARISHKHIAKQSHASFSLEWRS